MYLAYIISNSFYHPERFYKWGSESLSDLPKASYWKNQDLN